MAAAGKLAWKDLGKELILNDDTALGVIAVNANGNVITCCESLFKVWLEIQPEASWRQLIGALKEIKQGTLATQIEEMLEPSTYNCCITERYDSYTCTIRAYVYNYSY